MSLPLIESDSMNKTAAFVVLLYALLEKVTFVSDFPPATLHPAE